MNEKLFCDDCGFEEDELYEYEGEKFCFYCLSKIANIEIQTVENYYVNGNFYTEDEFDDMIEELDCKIIK